MRAYLNPACPRCNRTFSAHMQFCVYDGTPLRLAPVRGLAPSPLSQWKTRLPLVPGRPTKTRPVQIQDLTRTSPRMMGAAALRRFNRSLYKMKFQAVQDHGVPAWLANNSQASYMVKCEEGGYVLRVYPLTDAGLTAIRARSEYVGKNTFRVCEDLDALKELVSSNDYAIVDANRPKPRNRGPIITFG